jgi:hypothetical protein
MKYFLIAISLLICISCKDEIVSQMDNANKLERIPFNNTLTWIQRNAPQSKTTQMYIINSKIKLDSIAQRFINSDFFLYRFPDYNFTDSTLIEITLG